MNHRIKGDLEHCGGQSAPEPLGKAFGTAAFTSISLISGSGFAFNCVVVTISDLNNAIVHRRYCIQLNDYLQCSAMFCDLVFGNKAVAFQRSNKLFA